MAYPWLDVGAGDSRNREKLKELSNGEGQFYTSDMDLDNSTYSVPNGYFKLITSFEVIEHLYNPLFHLLELRRVIHPEGNLYLSTPNDYSLIYKAEHLLSRKYRPHFHQFSERDLGDIFARAGLKIVTLKKFYRSVGGTIARISRNGFLLHARHE